MDFIFRLLDYVIIWCIMLKFFFDFMRAFINKNYQQAEQIGENIKNKYGEFENIIDIIKYICSDVLNSDKYNDDMKVIAIKVLSGLKTT
ncbi:MAG: hypothetical protein EBZ44_07935 [Verrucomicrobia bacterium]|nr:hypothetical protein [Verrucomicrobiota bacterium]